MILETKVKFDNLNDYYPKFNDTSVDFWYKRFVHDCESFNSVIY